MVAGLSMVSFSSRMVLMICLSIRFSYFAVCGRVMKVSKKPLQTSDARGICRELDMIGVGAATGRARQEYKHLLSKTRLSLMQHLLGTIALNNAAAHVTGNVIARNLNLARPPKCMKLWQSVSCRACCTAQWHVKQLHAGWKMRGASMEHQKGSRFMTVSKICACPAQHLRMSLNASIQHAKKSGSLGGFEAPCLLLDYGN